MELIDKSSLVAEIERKIKEIEEIGTYLSPKGTLTNLLCYIKTLEVKEVDLNNGIQLTWEDIRELYIIFAEVDTEIELCMIDIQSETIGYYQEVLKRFKTRKGE